MRWALNGTPYNSPVTLAVAHNYIIYISNGAVQDNSSDTSTATTRLAAAATAAGITGATTAIPISPSGAANVADEWSRFMRRALGRQLHGRRRQGHERPGPGWSAPLRSMAGVSDGRYFDVQPPSAAAPRSPMRRPIFSEIQAVNSVFASVSLPVSVNTQGYFLNQVYVGMFRPTRTRCRAGPATSSSTSSAS